MKVRAEFEVVALAPGDVCAALRDPELIEWWVGKSFGLVERFEVRDVKKTPSAHVYEVRVEPATLGFVPFARKKRMETSRVEWDLVNLVQRWEYVGSASDQIRASGKDRLLPTDRGTLCQMRADIDIDVPVAGGVAEANAKRILKRAWRISLEHIVKRAAKRRPA